MSLSTVTVQDVGKFVYDQFGNRTISYINKNIIVDSDFQIDDISMPTPSEYYVNPSTMTLDAKRLPGNGEMIAPYLGTAFNVVWKYKYINAAQYKLLYDTYLAAAVTNKNMFHKIKTLDLNTMSSRTLNIYIQAEFKCAAYKMNRDGTFMYKDVELNMVDKAGEY